MKFQPVYEYQDGRGHSIRYSHQRDKRRRARKRAEKLMGKSYFTNISINFNELNNLMGKIPIINGIDVSELITNELLSNNDEISESNLKNKLGQTIILNDQLLAA